jgi:hypothetical protein
MFKQSAILIYDHKLLQIYIIHEKHLKSQDEKNRSDQKQKTRILTRVYARIKNPLPHRHRRRQPQQDRRHNCHHLHRQPSPQLQVRHICLSILL